MPMSVPGFAFSSISKVSGDLWVAFDIGNLCHPKVTAISLGFTRECAFKFSNVCVPAKLLIVSPFMPLLSWLFLLTEQR